MIELVAHRFQSDTYQTLKDLILPVAGRQEVLNRIGAIARIVSLAEVRRLATNLENLVRLAVR